MNNFYILSNSYDPTTANTNHELCFVKGFSELGINATWVFLLPSLAFDKIHTKYANINVKYLWSDFFSKNRVTRYIYKYFSLTRFILSLKKGDSVFVTGLPKFLKTFTKLSGVRVFHERTEHPEAVGLKSNTKELHEYIQACKNVDAMFVITKTLRDYFITKGVSPEKIHVINMVVDDERFKSLKKEQSNPYIAYCGKASNNKDGVDMLIKAFAIVNNKLPDVKLYIIGDQPTKESSNVELVNRLKLNDDVIFTGKVSSQQIPKLLKNASVLALARPDSLQNRHGFPTKLGEYLLTENPVVITKVGDIPLFLKDEVSAYMSECGDIDAFANNLIKALTNKEEACRIGKNGYKIALENFNYLTETRKIVDTLKDN